MTEKEAPLKTFKVLKQLGWQGVTHVLDDTVEMSEAQAAFWVEMGVLAPETKAKAQHTNKEGG